MQLVEYGADRGETILLLHGGGLSWWNYREAAELLQSDYHVVLPILDGHGGSDRPFRSIEENAEEILTYIEEKLGGSVLLIGGLSLGGQILLELLSRRRDCCSYALVESAAVIPSRITNALIGPAFGSSYGLIQNHPFHDGNKRIGALALLTLLDLNGIELEATNQELEQVIMNVAAGTNDYDAFHAWVLTHI